jgi:dihydrodipicolinate synthase/N-acetylneuraminate lyase
MPLLKPASRERLHRGVVIPAHPLALAADGTLDRARQAALTRYYLEAGAGGVAVGVHTTQFEIRQHGLYEDVLRIAIDTLNERERPEPVIAVAGVVGPTDSALKEAALARDLGYDLVLVGLGGLADWTERQLVDHVARIAEVMPVFGFYLQPSVGGRPLSYAFWRELAEIDNVEAIKIAPFNRYQTLDVVRAVAESSRRDAIALYTGNDDNIIADLLTTWRFEVDGRTVEKRIVGGLLGHWAVWTKAAVEQLDRCHAAMEAGDGDAIRELLTLGQQVTDSNAAFFDSANAFAGCIPGVHEVLRRQGLLAGTWCLNPAEVMSPGQDAEIDRVYEAYPHLNDDAFVAAHLEAWLSAPAGAARD